MIRICDDCGAKVLTDHWNSQHDGPYRCARCAVEKMPPHVNKRVQSWVRCSCGVLITNATEAREHLAAHPDWKIAESSSVAGCGCYPWDGIHAIDCPRRAALDALTREAQEMGIYEE